MRGHQSEALVIVQGLAKFGGAARHFALQHAGLSFQLAQSQGAFRLGPVAFPFAAAQHRAKIQHDATEQEHLNQGKQPHVHFHGKTGRQNQFLTHASQRRQNQRDEEQSPGQSPGHGIALKNQEQAVFIVAGPVADDAPGECHSSQGVESGKQVPTVRRQ